MSTKARCFQATVERLEGRIVLTSGNPANTLATAQGVVTAPGAVADVTVQVSAQNINGRIPIIIGTATSPTGNSDLLPKVVAAIGPDGSRLPVRQGAPYAPGRHGEATAYVQASTAGPMTIEVTGARNTSGAFSLRAYLPGDSNGTGQVSYADLQSFARSFKSRVGDALYNPATDANLNQQIGQTDGRFMIRNLNPGTHKIPLQIKVTLEPSEAVKGPVPSNSGGHTYYKHVTILGKTTPGSLVFFDSGLGNYAFDGGAVATDAQGNFSVTSTNKDGINNNDFLVIDPWGQQKIFDYPIYYFPAASSSGRPSPKPLGTSSGAAQPGTSARSLAPSRRRASPDLQSITSPPDRFVAGSPPRFQEAAWGLAYGER